MLVATQRRQPLLRPRDGAAARRAGRAQRRRRRGARRPRRRRGRAAAALPAPWSRRRARPCRSRRCSVVDFDAGLIAAAAGRPVLDDLDEAHGRGHRTRRRPAGHRPLRARARPRDAVRRPACRPACPTARSRRAGARRTTAAPGRAGQRGRPPLQPGRGLPARPARRGRRAHPRRPRAPRNGAARSRRPASCGAGGRARRARSTARPPSGATTPPRPGLVADASR